MKSLKIKVIAGIIAIFGVGLFPLATAGAINIIGESCGSGATAKICDAQKEDIGRTNFVQRVTNTLLYILGVIAVIAIIAGGIRYATANGDASRIKQAKDTILYAVIGLVVAIMAWGIVSFVVGAFN